MFEIAAVEGREILDSRGRPTVWAAVQLRDGTRGAASVPSGASTGTAEARELRDGEPRRYRGWGCRRAVASIEGEIADALVGMSFTDQAAIDAQLIQQDGSPQKERLGANAILAVSLACARAEASRRRQPLYAYFSELVGSTRRQLPRLTINLFSGGKHAGQQVALQDVLMVPHAATVADGLAMAFEVYQSAAELTNERYGMRALTADEGGLAPPFPSTVAMLDDAAAAIARAGLTLGRDMSLAIDVAATHFLDEGSYRLDNARLSALELVERLAAWVDAYKIVSVEDGLAEDDWDHWPRLCAAIADRALVMGDDLLCTNVTRLERARRSQAATALLLKVNQIGTLTEAAEAWRAARVAGWQVTVSARSGETEDDWLADLSVAWGDQIKVGSITQSERLAKYNRLLAIEAETGWPVCPWPAPR